MSNKDIALCLLYNLFVVSIFATLAVILTSCSEDDTSDIRSNLADWECKQNLENELFPDSTIQSTQDSIETLCKNDKFRLYLSTN